MDLYEQISTHSTRSICFLLLIFEVSSIISNVSAVTRLSSSSQHQPSEQIIVGRPYKKTTDNNRLQHRQNHLSNKSQDEILREDQLKYPSQGTLNVNEAVSSSSFPDGSLITQSAIGDHSLADDSLPDGDNKSDTESLDTLDEPKIEGE